MYSDGFKIGEFFQVVKIHLGWSDNYEATLSCF